MADYRVYYFEANSHYRLVLVVGAIAALVDVRALGSSNSNYLADCFLEEQQGLSLWQ